MNNTMTFGGDDWLKPSEAKSKQSALKAHEKAQEKALAALNKAADAMRELYWAASHADLPGVRREGDDGRMLLTENIREFAGHLEIVIESRKRK